MPQKEIETIECSPYTIIELIDQLIKNVNEDPSLYQSIKNTKISKRGFRFATLVKVIRGDSKLDSLKMAKRRLRKDIKSKKNIDESDTNYNNLKILYEEANEKFFGVIKLPYIQSISVSACKEAKDYGIDWEREVKKFRDYLQFNFDKNKP